MAEVRQEDFKLGNYKLLSEELRQKMIRPNPIYEKQSKMNPRLIKNQTQIEDFVQIQPTQSESYSNLFASEETQSIQYQQNSNKVRKDITSNEFFLQQDSMFNDNTNAITVEEQYQIQPQPAPLAIAEDPQIVSKNIQKQADEENTFLTNMPEEEDNNNVQQNTSLKLPKIVSNQDQLRQDYQNQNIEVRDETQAQTASDNREISMAYKDDYQQLQQYQYLYNQDLRQVQEQRSQSTMEKYINNSSSSVTSLQTRGGLQTQRVGLSNSEQSILPFSRSRLQREESELSFVAGRRLSLNSKQQPRILGNKLGFQHSQLSSVLGRQSRVLDQIYKRVQKFQSNEKNYSKLGFQNRDQQLQDVYSQMQKGSSTDRVGGQYMSNNNIRYLQSSSNKKYSVFQGIGGARRSHHDSYKASSVEPINIELVQIERPNNKMNETYNSKNSRGSMQSKGRSGAKNNLILIKAAKGDPYRNPSKINTSVDQSEDEIQMKAGQFQSLNSQSSWNIQQQEQEKQQKSSNLKSSDHKKSNQYSSIPQSIQLLDAEYVPQNKFQSKKSSVVLNKYKQRQLSNAQLSKLIRKDSSAFVTEDKPNDYLGPQQQLSSSRLYSNPNLDMPLSSRVPSNIKAPQYQKNSLLDSEKSYDKSKISKDIKELIQASFQEAPLEIVSGGVYSSQKHQTVITDDQKNYMTQVNSKVFHLPSQQSSKNKKSDTRKKESKFYLDFDNVMTPAHIPLKTNVSRIPTIPSDSNFEQYQAENNSHNVQLDKTVTTSRQDRSDRIQNEMSSYYRSLNVAAKNSQKKLQKVIIRGKNILDPQLGSTLGEQNQGSQVEPGDISHVTFQSNIEESITIIPEQMVQHQVKNRTPFNVHMDQEVQQNREKNEKRTDSATTLVKNISIPGSLRQQNKPRTRVHADGLVQLRSTDSLGMNNNSQNPKMRNFSEKNLQIQQDVSEERTLIAPPVTTNILDAQRQPNAYLNQQKLPTINPKLSQQKLRKAVSVERSNKDAMKLKPMAMNKFQNKASSIYKLDSGKASKIGYRLINSTNIHNQEVGNEQYNQTATHEGQRQLGKNGLIVTNNNFQQKEQEIQFAEGESTIVGIMIGEGSSQSEYQDIAQPAQYDANATFYKISSSMYQTKNTLLFNNPSNARSKIVSSSQLSEDQLKVQQPPTIKIKMVLASENANHIEESQDLSQTNNKKSASNIQEDKNDLQIQMQNYQNEHFVEINSTEKSNNLYTMVQNKSRSTPRKGQLTALSMSGSKSNRAHNLLNNNNNTDSVENLDLLSVQDQEVDQTKTQQE